MATYKTIRRGADDYELNIVVQYAAHAAHRGARDSLCGKRGAGPPLEPDEPAWIEIEYATDEDGNIVELTDSEVGKLQEEIGEHL